MQITHFTARKQVGFKLPSEAFAVLKALEGRGSGLLAGYSLETNLLSVSNVLGSSIGLGNSATVYVDFSTGVDESVPTIDEAAKVIMGHAEAALALDRFIPGLIQGHPVATERCFVDGSAPCFVQPSYGHLIHFDEHFVVLADQSGQSGSVHYLRNGKPAWTALDDLSDMSHVFAKVIDLDRFEDAEGPFMATGSLDSVTAWVMEKAYVPDLENDRNYDLEGHPLREMVTFGAVAYADIDVIVTSSGQRLTIHHTDADGRYGVKVLEGAAGDSLSALIAMPGLDILDPTNPARERIDIAIEERRLYLATRDAPATRLSANA